MPTAKAFLAISLYLYIHISIHNSSFNDNLPVLKNFFLFPLHGLNRYNFVVVRSVINTHSVMIL